MFNNSLKKEALRIHEETLNRYNKSYETMGKACEALYDVRGNSVNLIKLIQRVVNSIANTPKEFDTELGKIGKELTQFNETEEYAKKAYEASLKAGVNIAGGTATGIGVAAMAPTAMMSIATTFGRATTGTAISALSGAAAQKAAVAWLGRTFAGFAVKEGAGMAVGQAVLALAGPIGWGITAASTGISLLSLNSKNKELADDAVKEAKDIAKAREALDETTERINGLKSKTDTLYNDINRQKDKITGYMNVDYMSLKDFEKEFLGSLVNNTLSLSFLLNETIN
jgi:hypothetical protein